MSVYGLRFHQFVPLDIGGPLTLQALVTGEIDVCVLFTTDPGISGHGLVELEDDRGLQPAENVTPVVRRAIVTAYGPALEMRLNEVSARLGTDQVRDLNAQLGASQRAAEVAARWLAAAGLT